MSAMTWRCAVAFLALGPAAARPRDLASLSFDAFVREFGKAYGTSEEHGRRQAIFEQHRAAVRAHNEGYVAGRHGWWMEVNEFADWTPAEFRALLRTQPHTSSRAGHDATPSLGAQANPDSVDWREKQVVTPVKDQGHCGACWAFAAVEALESQYAIATGRLLELSPQACVSCVQNPQRCGGKGGCQGATMELAFNLTADRGVPLEADLPYRGRNGACSAYRAAVKATGYVKLPVNDAAALETAVATKGPVAVIVAAMPWQLYGGGLFSGCSANVSKDLGFGADLDHGVLVVGYTKDAWLVRNSWGPRWGEQGYIRLSRKADGETNLDHDPADGVACEPYPKTQAVAGECGILFDASYPTGVHAATARRDALVV